MRVISRDLRDRQVAKLLHRHPRVVVPRRRPGALVLIEPRRVGVDRSDALSSCRKAFEVRDQAALESPTSLPMAFSSLGYAEYVSCCDLIRLRDVALELSLGH